MGGPAARRRRRGRTPLLLKTEMGAGHGGPSGRYDAWREEAEVLAFILATARGQRQADRRRGPSSTTFRTTDHHVTGRELIDPKHAHGGSTPRQHASTRNTVNPTSSADRGPRRHRASPATRAAPIATSRTGTTRTAHGGAPIARAWDGQPRLVELRDASERPRPLRRARRPTRPRVRPRSGRIRRGRTPSGHRRARPRGRARGRCTMTWSPPRMDGLDRAVDPREHAVEDRGTERTSACQPMPANLSSPFLAKRRHRLFLIRGEDVHAERPGRSMCGQLVDVLPGEERRRAAARATPR